MENTPLALHVEAIHIANYRQHFGQGDIFQFDRDQPGDPGMHRHAIAGALEQGTEKLHRFHVMGSNTQPLLRHGNRHLRPVQLQQLALHRLGQRGQGGILLLLLLIHRLLERVLGLSWLWVLVGSAACGHHGQGDQTETVYFHVISAPCNETR